LLRAFIAKICFVSFFITLKTLPKAPAPTSSTIVNELKFTEDSSKLELVVEVSSSSHMVSSSPAFSLIGIISGASGSSLKSLTGLVTSGSRISNFYAQSIAFQIESDHNSASS